MARAKRICKRTGCGKVAIVRGWCLEDARAADLARGTRHQRGYDASHVAVRERLMIAFAAAARRGVRVTCWRCGQPMYPWQALAADHAGPSAASGGTAQVLVHLDPCNSGRRLPGS